MGKATGFMEYTRAEAAHRPVEQRVRDYGACLLPCGEAHIRTQSARCMDCGVPFCHAGMLVPGGSIGCPLGNLIPETNDLAYRGDWDEAYRRLSLTHPFPEITGRVCPALCEGSCTAGQHAAPVAVRDIERTLADYGLGLAAGAVASPIPQPTGRRVAVVGSGPSGLACADALSRRGHAVTVFEQADRPGGFLMYGIPNMKLEKAVVENRVRLLKGQGVEFRLGCRVGEDISADQVVDGYDAVVLCIGARSQRTLNAPGSGAVGVATAVDYLTAATRQLLDGVPVGEELSAKGKDVVVIGGGDTGTDCIATAIRQGAKSVAALEIMPPLPESRAENNPWPLWPRVRKVDYGHEEAMAVFGRDVREYETTVKEIVPENGRAAGVVTVQVRWEQDAAGRPTPVELLHTLQTRKASLILTAMGFTGAEPSLPQKMQLSMTPRGTVDAPAGDSSGRGGFATHLPGVFAAGDARRGPSLVVWAIQEGMRAAKECHAWLCEKHT